MVEKNTLVFFEEDIGEKLFSNDIYHICNFTRNDFRGKKVQIGNLNQCFLKDRVCIRIKTAEFFFHEIQKKHT